jgi:hypothetical protein
MTDLWCKTAASFLLCMLLSLSAMPAQAQPQPASRNTLSVGGYYSSGDYGSDRDTRIRYLPLSYLHQTGKWVFQATVPGLDIEGPGNVLVNVGGVDRAGASEEVFSSRGIGDIVASVSYQFEPLGNSGVFVDLLVEAKIPTADEDKGLGTGEFDYAAQLDFYGAIGNTTLIASLGYQHRGRSDIYIGLENGLFVQLGFQHPVTELLSAGILYDYSEPASKFSEEIHELVPYINWELTPQWSLLTYGAWGFTQDSPDFAAGVQLSFRW